MHCRDGGGGNRRYTEVAYAGDHSDFHGDGDPSRSMPRPDSLRCVEDVTLASMGDAAAMPSQPSLSHAITTVIGLCGYPALFDIDRRSHRRRIDRLTESIGPTQGLSPNERPRPPLCRCHTTPYEKRSRSSPTPVGDALLDEYDARGGHHRHATSLAARSSGRFLFSNTVDRSARPIHTCHGATGGKWVEHHRGS